VENLAAHGYFDYARLKEPGQRFREIFSYGAELTCGSTYLRFGAGYAWSRLPGKQSPDHTAYLKVGMALPGINAQYRKAAGLPE